MIDQIAKVNYKYTFPLANALKKAGVEIELIIDQKTEKENCLCERIRLFNTDEKGIGKFQKFVNYIGSYIRIGTILKKSKIDILHTEWYTFSPIDYYFLKKYKNKYGLKYIATVHDILPFNEKKYDKYFHQKLYALADKIILQAPANVQRFAELFPESAWKTKMIPHGHMIEYVQNEDKRKCRKKLGIPQDKVVFLFFGQIKKVKGVDVLLKAILNLRKTCPNAYTIIAGSVWKADFTECQEIIENHDLSDCLKTDIRYIPDEEVKLFYSAADVCVLPYTDVYQSGVIQLAYGYKKPVIATTLPAFTQFVKENETGFLAVPGDSESLESAMKRAIKNKDHLEQIGLMGYEMVKKELNWDDIAKRIINECYKTN